MKIPKLIHVATITFALLVLSCDEECGSDYGTIRFINESNSETVLVYIDDNYQGLPVSNSMKSQEIIAGTHEFSYRLSVEEDFTRRTVTVKPCEEVMAYIR